MNPVRIILYLACVFTALVAKAYTPTENGLYAQFDTTAGQFTCLLLFNKAPLTVANFVGLAEGSKNWYDYENHKISNEPFYDGLTFHRISTTYSIIQGGSRNGQGNDSPGYYFPMEIDPSLTHEAGVISMARTAYPNTNGAQFFVTSKAVNSFDNHYSVFGRVVDGLNIVKTINEAATKTESSESPLNPVHINKVTIIRIGAEANAFNPNDYELPKVSKIPQSLSHEDGQFKLTIAPSVKAPLIEVSESDDLQTWRKIPSNKVVPIQGTTQGEVVLSTENLADKSHFIVANGLLKASPFLWQNKMLSFTYTEDGGLPPLTETYRVGSNGIAYFTRSGKPPTALRNENYHLDGRLYQFCVYSDNLAFNVLYYMTFDEGSETEGDFYTILLNAAPADPFEYGLNGRFSLAD